MKTTILISGGISGNYHLRGAISFTDERSGMFNSIRLLFATKKEAEKSLWEAYKKMRSDGETSLSYSKGFLSYDASSAKVIPASIDDLNYLKEFC